MTSEILEQKASNFSCSFRSVVFYLKVEYHPWAAISQEKTMIILLISDTGVQFCVGLCHQWDVMRYNIVIS